MDDLKALEEGKYLERLEEENERLREQIRRQKILDRFNAVIVLSQWIWESIKDVMRAPP